MSRLRIVCEIELGGKHSVVEGKKLYAYVDQADVDLVKDLKWHVTGGYACAWIPLHRLIADAMGLEIPAGCSIDHINRNKLDNTRSNLRVATQQVQVINQGLRKDNKTGFKGVSWHTRDAKWRASIKRGEKQVQLGYFNTAEEASAAYEKAAKEWADSSR
ncbi:HNH endonuclease [uncultured virus]|nr:HNH endonuclease [uncultured virus]